MGSYYKLADQVREILNKRDYEARLISTTHKRLALRREAEALENYQELREKIREAKQKVIKNLDYYLGRLRYNLESKNIKVFLAKDRFEALNYILNLAKEKGVKKVVKSKSMVSEEIHIREALEQEGIEVFETDLGERILQLAKEKPDHLIAPALHKSLDELVDLFTKDLGYPVPRDPEELVKHVRKSLRNEFLSADMNISGINIAVAENGALFIVSNEGNARLGLSLAKVQVVVMGIEKIVPTLEDAFKVLKLLGRSATGQKLPVYVSIIYGAIGNFSDSYKDFHVVIVDNGRSKALKDERFSDALLCIRCGACLNTCPTYRLVGGKLFGDIYTGPIGIPWTYLTTNEEKAVSISPLCVSCGLCEGVCPAKIKIPEMIMWIKEKAIEKDSLPIANRFIARLDSSARLACKFAPILNWLMDKKSFRILMEYFTHLDHRRPFPKYASTPLEEWFKNRKSKVNNPIDKVAYFADIYANYNEPELGIKVTELLEGLDVEVVFPKQMSAGMQMLAYGNIKPALKNIKLNSKSFAEWVKKGYKVVSSEPTAAFCLKLLYHEIYPNEDTEILTKNSFEFFEYLNHLIEKKGLRIKVREEYRNKRLAYHAPCHTKSLFFQWPVMELLKRLSLKVEPIHVTCCGIAGSYGFKKGYEGYEVSMRVGEELFNKIKEIGPDYILTESSVCKMQIEHGAKVKAIHPITLLSINSSI
ncbi:MAG: anaerobic glycerol-3-phosphate dehydrogenase subunit C [Nitrososphaerales archaeon]